MKYKYLKLKFFPTSFYILFAVVFLPFILESQSRNAYYDGPYIFHQNDSLRIQWIEAGEGHDTLIAKTDAAFFKRDSLPVVNLQDLDFKKEEKVAYNDIKKVISLSDVHGQYDILIQLLQAHQVIDSDNKWIYKKGHLVIVGDNFDRGDKVTEILWFLFYLQKEAEIAEGKVHVLLGNHEVMVLNNDLRYLNRKYRYTSAFFVTRYDKFYREGSVLGDWIASHNVVLSINENLYVHAGISPSLVRENISLEEINNTFRNTLLRKEIPDSLMTRMQAALSYEEGPIWYRGYFDTLQMNVDTIDYILDKLNQKTIIVGHTSFDSITPMLEMKVIAVDSSIKLGKDGQALIMQKGNIYIGDLDGKRKKIFGKPKVKKTSVFNYLYEKEGHPKITINTDMGQLLKRKGKEEYQDATFHIAEANGGKTLPARLRARGNMRKKVCRFPPVKVDFDKSDLDSLDFLKVDKLKVVFPCQDRDSDQEKLYKEYFLYGLYNLIDSNCIRAKLIDINIIEKEKEKFNFVGFIVEDEDEYARRKKAKIVESGRLKFGGLEREPFIKMEFFQYMIANTDWSVSNKHNLEMVKLPDLDRVVALPYDFDYSGFVGQRYAVPYETLPIKSVHERYFFSYKATEEEVYRMIDYYLSMEQEIYDYCDTATYMKPKTIENNKKYISKFFDQLRKPKRIISKKAKK